MRPHKTVRKRLKGLGGTPGDSGASISSRRAFETLANAVGRHYRLTPVAFSEHNLDNKGAVERVALLCAADAETGGYLIHNADTEQRWLIQFSELDGRSALEDGAGKQRCANMEPPKRHTGWITGTKPWLEFAQTHRGGGAWCRIALRGGKVVMIRYSYLNDAREGDEEEVTDYERAGGPYPDLAARSTERCMIDIKVQSISAATVLCSESPEPGWQRQAAPSRATCVLR